MEINSKKESFKMSNYSQEFDNKSVIITGAGKGIGRATAIEMARRGAKVISMARTQSDLVSLQADIGCTTIKVDLTDNVLPALRSNRLVPAII